MKRATKIAKRPATRAGKPVRARAVPGDPVAATRAAGELYFQAWVARDLERILALHTPDSDFVLHGADGVQVWRGIEAVRQIFDLILRSLPDQTFDVQSMVVKEDFLVAHSIVTATLVLPWPMGGRTYLPSGRAIQFEIVDICHFQGDKIRLKEGWLDALAMHNQLTQSGN